VPGSARIGGRYTSIMHSRCAPTSSPPRRKAFTLEVPYLLPAFPQRAAYLCDILLLFFAFTTPFLPPSPPPPTDDLYAVGGERAGERRVTACSRHASPRQSYERRRKHRLHPRGRWPRCGCRQCSTHSPSSGNHQSRCTPGGNRQYDVSDPPSMSKQMARRWGEASETLAH